MRQFAIVAIVVVGLGVVALLRGGTGTATGSSALTSQASLMASEIRGMSPWLLVGAILSGLVLVAASARPKT
jgi:hypothetical protein